VTGRETVTIAATANQGRQPASDLVDGRGAAGPRSAWERGKPTRTRVTVRVSTEKLARGVSERLRAIRWLVWASTRAESQCSGDYAMMERGSSVMPTRYAQGRLGRRGRWWPGPPAADPRCSAVGVGTGMRASGPPADARVAAQ
jgi:hypothetical protein